MRHRQQSKADTQCDSSMAASPVDRPRISPAFPLVRLGMLHMQYVHRLDAVLMYKYCILPQLQPCRQHMECMLFDLCLAPPQRHTVRRVLQYLPSRWDIAHSTVDLHPVFRPHRMLHTFHSHLIWCRLSRVDMRSGRCLARYPRRMEYSHPHRHCIDLVHSLHSHLDRHLPVVLVRMSRTIASLRLQCHRYDGVFH